MGAGREKEERSEITGDVSSPLTDSRASCSLIRLNPLVRASHSSGTSCPNDAWNSQMAKVCNGPFSLTVASAREVWFFFCRAACASCRERQR